MTKLIVNQTKTPDDELHEKVQRFWQFYTHEAFSNGWKVYAFGQCWYVQVVNGLTVVHAIL